MPWDLPVPAFSGDAGIGELVASMREPGYVRLLGKSVGTGLAAGLIARRLPPQAAGVVCLIAGVYLGLEMAAYLEEEAAKRRGPVLDATARAAGELEVDLVPPALEGDDLLDGSAHPPPGRVLEAEAAPATLEGA